MPMVIGCKGFAGFVTRKGIDMWYDDIDYYDEDNFFKWYEGYKKRKAQKASIKEELMQR